MNPNSMLDQCVSFPPLITNTSQVLILGSMPGKESLLKREYYANPRNYFWRLMHELFETGLLVVPYAQRIKILNEKGVALWDVINSCSREGSLDSDIIEHSVIFNDFKSLFVTYPNIKAIFFNGQKARDLFCNCVLTHLPNISRDRIFEALPSTSPANAAISFEDKLARWSLVSKIMV